MTHPTCARSSRFAVHERRFGSLRAVLWCVLLEALHDAGVHAAIEQAERAGVYVDFGLVRHGGGLEMNSQEGDGQ